LLHDAQRAVQYATHDSPENAARQQVGLGNYDRARLNSDKSPLALLLLQFNFAFAEWTDAGASA
jgi:hypothetical protein